MCLDHIPKPVEGVNMILEEETFKKFGYYPSDLKPKSNKRILVQCDDCGRIREIDRCNYTTSLCQSCTRKGKRHPNWKGDRIERICEQCNKPFIIDPCIAKRESGNRFCSPECWGLWLSKNNRGIKNPSYKEKIKCICPICNKEFEALPFQIKRGRKYCSYSCSNKNTRKNLHIPKYHTKPELVFENICKKYNLPFEYTGDGSFWIKNINPDFVECDGKKVAVEIFGDYWHSPLLRQNIPFNQTYEGRKKILKEYGWKLIVFWESDLLREDAEQFILLELSKYPFLPSFQ